MRIVGPPDRQLAAWEQQIEDTTRQALRQVMNRIADRITGSLTAALVAHLPGKHDQSSHGKGGGADWRKSNDDAEAALVATSATPLIASTPLGGGWTASVKIEDHEGGMLVRKDFPPSDSIRSPEKQVDAEILGSRVAHAMGIDAPAVARDSEHSVIMERVNGRTWAEQSPYKSAPASLVDSREGRMLGLFDVLVANPDRNHGNWMTTDEGGVVAIDHGLAFGGWSAGVGSPFARYLSNDAGNNWADQIDISPGDMATIRGRLDSLRGDFEASGRIQWHSDMMDRLDALEPRATGTRSRLR